MRHAALFTSMLFVIIATALGACGPGATATDAGGHDAGSKPTCTQIFEACHPVDTGSGPAHECHEFAEAEATTEAQCQMRRTECLSACALSDASVQDTATGADAASGGDTASEAAAHDHDH